MGVFIVIIFLILSYLIGAIPFGYIIAKLFKKIDIREYGSRNIGATNVFRTIGKKTGILCLILDILKGLVPVILIATLSYAFISDVISLSLYKLFLGLAAISGHIWPVYLKFKGGKGVATAFGVILGIEPVSVSFALIFWAVLLLLFRMVSLASILAALSLPFITAFRGVDTIIIVFSLIIAILVVLRHRENITRIIKREEKKI